MLGNVTLMLGGRSTYLVIAVSHVVGPVEVNWAISGFASV
jgi:hypothetical protein